MNEGYIKLSRKIVDWEWYKNINTCRLFIHLLFKANWKDGRFEGIEIPRGSLVTSLPTLSSETGLSVQQIRTAEKHLKSTGEITVSLCPKFRIISIKNYCEYQDINSQTNRQLTGDQQATNRQLTAIEERKKGIREEYKEKRVSKDTPKEKTEKTPDDIISQYDFSPEMAAKIKEWLEYKRERREAYKSTGLTALLKRISQKSGEFGENPVMALMDESMANGWRGIIWDRLKKEDKENGIDWDDYLKGGLRL